MRHDTIVTIIRNLNEARVSYMVVGGLAVNAHGFVRLTMDLDLILALDADNLRSAINVFKTMGYTPRAPVAIDEYLDDEKRRQWKQAKGLAVFSLYSARYPETEIDLFTDDPLGFSDARKRAVQLEVAPGVRAAICGLADLIRLKEQSGRPRDLEDIRNLRLIHPEN
jgi:hypothetical protein